MPRIPGRARVLCIHVVTVPGRGLVFSRPSRFAEGRQHRFCDSLGNQHQETMRELHQILEAYWPHIVFTVSLVRRRGRGCPRRHDQERRARGHRLGRHHPVFTAAGRAWPTSWRRSTGYASPGYRNSATMPWWPTRSASAPDPDVVPLSAPQFASLKTLADKVSHFQLLGGNAVQLLDGGDEAYPAMIQSIRQARYTVALQSYIFDNDPIGREVAQALIEAQARGVQVRVLIDAVGSHYSRPPIVRMLEERGVPTARFMTNPLGVLRMPYANLRSHRKILVVDGSVGFSGGMNIRAAFVSALSREDTNRDTHFRYEGPVVTQLLSVFAHDWDFTTGESPGRQPVVQSRGRHGHRFRRQQSTLGATAGTFRWDRHHSSTGTTVSTAAGTAASSPTAPPWPAS